MTRASCAGCVRPGGWAAVAAFVMVAHLASAQQLAFSYDDSCESAGSFFDFNGLLCSACPTNAVGGEQPSAGCSCAPGYRLNTATADNEFNFGTCASCAVTSQATSADGLRCLTCDGSTGPIDTSNSNRRSWTPASYSASASDCVCSTTSAGTPSVITETDASGGPILVAASGGGNVEVKRCVPCPAGTYISADAPGVCTRCEDPKEVKGDGTCRCKAGAGSACSDSASLLDVLSTDLKINMITAAQVTARDVPVSASATTNLQVDSAVFSSLLGPAATDCYTSGGREGCNALANLCVLQMYDTSTPACRIYNEILDLRRQDQYHQTDGWSLTLPWLYYEGVAQVYLRSVEVPTEVSFDSGDPGHRLGFYASASALNGTWLGMTNLTDQLQLCGGLVERNSDWARFGTSYDNRCSLSLSSLAAAYPEPVFYDLYMDLQSGGTTSLYPVPVLNRALVSGGLRVNDDGVAGNDVLTRRVFVTDAASGVESAGRAPRFIRYADEIELKIEIRSEKNRIFPPVLTVGYASRSPGLEGTVRNPSQFKVLYTQDISNFWDTWNILFVVALVVSFFVWFFRMFCYQRRRQNPVVDFEYMWRAIVEAVAVGSYAFFFLLFFVAMYWFVFYKMQSVVYTMIPEDREVGRFKTVLIFTAIGQSLSVLDTILRQVNYDMFLLDWEKPRQIVEPGGERLEHAPVAMWRSLFIANEWTELQVTRQANFAFTMFWVVLLLVGLKLDGLGNITPSMGRLDTHYYHDSSVVLRFATASFLIGAITLVQVLYKKIYHHRYVNHPLETFVDLLSLTKVSVILFEDTFSGYYLHGQSNIPHADTTMVEVNAELAKVQSPSRGLVTSANREDLKHNQVFQVYLDPKVRADYDAKFLNNVKSQHNEQRDQSAFGVGYLARPKTAVGRTLENKEEVSQVFRNMINGLESKGADRVKEKTFFQRLLHVPPDMTEGRRLGSLFVHDFDNTFGRLTFYNIELQLIVWNILVFTAVDMATVNTGVAAAVTFFLQWALEYARTYMGDNNISRKTLVDAKFLV